MRRYRWEIALLLVTVVWGSTFVMVKRAVEIIPPLVFMAPRFALGAIAIAILRPRELRTITRTELLSGVGIGVVLFGGYAGQTIGLQYARSSNVGFITGLYVVMVPAFGALALRHTPSRSTLAGVSLAVAGLFLLTAPAGRFGAGEAWSLFCAASFAIQILLVGTFAPRVRAVPFASVQLATVAACAGLGSIPSFSVAGMSRFDVWGAVVFTAIVATSFAFIIQTGAQRVIPPTRSGIIFAMESPFAALFGAWLGHDRLGAAGITGGLLMLVGMLVSEVFAPAKEEI